MNAICSYRVLPINAQHFVGSWISARKNSTLLPRRYYSHVVAHGRPFRMAVLGSGPAGFYTAYKVMSSIPDAMVDMYECLPTPYGLVRYGVAPDHQGVKNCEEKFATIASSKRFNFVGNLNIGKDLPLSSLANNYNAILFAYGASKDRKLGIENEEKLGGIYSARAFVGWYNGLPEYTNLAPDLEAGEDAVVVGQGNVALDIARILLTNVDHLKKTDIAQNALSALCKSRVKRVRVIGRRGPMQAAFTIKEVRELMRLPAISFSPITRSLLPSDPSKLPRTQKRLVELLLEHPSIEPLRESKSWSLDFHLSPISFNSSSTKSTALTSVTFAKTKVEGGDQFDPSAKVTSTNEHVDISASLAFRSIGYKSEALSGMTNLGIHFDEARGLISNDAFGRVHMKSQSGSMQTIPGFYCAGWVKRGPTGVIANTMEDAFATAEAISEDYHSGVSFLPGGHGWSALREEIDKQGIRTTSWDDWYKIDNAERARGKNRGKEREKFTNVADMLKVLN